MPIQFHFRTSNEMGLAFRDNPKWLHHTVEISERCNFEFPFGKPQFPPFIPPNGESSRQFFRRLVFEGVRRRYDERPIISDTGAVVPREKVIAQIEDELSIIAD